MQDRDVDDVIAAVIKVMGHSGGTRPAARRA
jgi:hypothetical protein